MKKLPKKFLSPKEGKLEKPQKSPSIPRKIPEEKRDYFSWVRPAKLRVHGEVIFISFFSGILLMGIGIAGVSLWRNMEELKARQVLREGLIKEKRYWEEIVGTYPDYRDAYFQLGLVSYQLGEKEGAQKAIEKVLEIDPTAEKAREFAEKLSK